MSVFWFGAALLLIIAVLAVIWPLWRQRYYTETSADLRAGANVRLYREHLEELEQEYACGRMDDTQFNALSRELQRNLLDDQRASEAVTTNRRGTLYIVVAAVLVVLAGSTLYFNRGGAGDVLFARMQQQLASQGAHNAHNWHSFDGGNAETLLQAVRERLKKRPDNNQYWYLLGRYASEVGDFATAEHGFRELYKRAPEKQGNAAQLAQAIFLHSGNKITPEVVTLTDKALQMNPQDVTALGLAGINAFEHKRFSNAAHYWRRATALMPNNTPGKQALVTAAARAESHIKTQPKTSAENDKANPAHWSIPITVKLAKGLQVPKGATLFVFARRYHASPMPLVVTRQKAGKFPVSIILDETMAMTSKSRLFQEGQIELVAKLSQSGNVNTTPGDLKGTLGPLDIHHLPSTIVLTIDTTL